MRYQGARVADVGNMICQLERFDEPASRGDAAFELKLKERSAIRSHIFFGLAADRLRAQEGIGNVGHLRLFAQGVRQCRGVRAMTLHSEWQGLQPLEEKK